MFKNCITVNIKNGVHTRIAAMIVHEASKLKEKYGINLYVKQMNAKEPIAISMLALLSLKIKENELVEISCFEDTTNGQRAVIELSNYITKSLGENIKSFSNIDAIIEESTLVNENVLENIPMGIIVVDINCNITSINDYALNIMDKNIESVIGMPVLDIIPTSDTPLVIKTKEKKLGKTQHINKHIVISNCCPIISNNNVIGALCVFQDISELVGIKELNERFQKILETSHDLICFIDENRKISYINPTYEKCLNIKSEDVLGKDLMKISPDGYRMKVFNSKKPIENVVYTKNNVGIICTVVPIFIGETFKGVISISKEADEIIKMAKELEKSEEELNYYKDELKRHNKLSASFNNIIGNSSSLRDVLITADKAADSTSTVLIRGESGTGKELIAKAIHNGSPRKDKPFVRVNCAAIPENLIESELFGYEKGAFTGAVKSKPGKFAIANTGTIFLDEIGDIPKSMQVKLLRVLQEREFESVGGIETQKVDVRIIAATNRNLEEMLKTGEFREDLYYRLNVLSIFLPPLRKRKEDINLLVEHFINNISKKLNKPVKKIEESCLSCFMNYNWPGNIRELENIIERSINMCDDGVIMLKDLPFYITNIAPQNDIVKIDDNSPLLKLEDYEKIILTIAMKKYKSYNKVGKILGITHRTVSLKCKKYNIDVQ
ncbi:transcriptional regulator with PAS, ATPase and Fis domain/phosphotransferase system HPr-like phosphotransfer protein [Clostridium acetobutylicum]|uniref:HTH-type transcriptional regulatory protein TyrR n=1 Tax=Clostridium acetobutylicum (strain ATCC 824 / DSM 792 / JCM 1419 / IAM 19013 / LMG 5710 / NBRC 13948 / NRRL B-527 / VKM B-1787 / 2291 / W) TaxID=272562 RepID=Q97EM2_CLOAB|nr:MULTISPECIES: sigma 54-interacting transcriptional regulator [Clostridium]AAK81028.1 NtrC family transcriptional regulator, ATPase domain fused to two PAS domains [Clostridium acetobutylicum ATCC 824]ADZ22131.1 NtrC family transcriptional regulator, ATPase domain fused to two PAS domains [Clostridium acetobutylicum EA 2018]AEI33977.1 transcriptional regulator [Clostridium acetobutylicum DSM 1731]AWV78561.1 PAS domain-containing protein [Clostridium acetobutylicum]MBC2393421.1 sigma 54-inter